jgi:hypothetical protein
MELNIIFDILCILVIGFLGLIALLQQQEMKLLDGRNRVLITILD